MAITLFKSQTNVQDKKGHRDYISSCLNGKIFANVCLEVYMRFDENIVIYYHNGIQNRKHQFCSMYIVLQSL